MQKYCLAGGDPVASPTQDKTGTFKFRNSGLNGTMQLGVYTKLNINLVTSQK